MGELSEMCFRSHRSNGQWQTRLGPFYSLRAARLVPNMTRYTGWATAPALKP